MESWSEELSRWGLRDQAGVMIYEMLALCSLKLLKCTKWVPAPAVVSCVSNKGRERQTQNDSGPVLLHFTTVDIIDIFPLSQKGSCSGLPVELSQTRICARKHKSWVKTSPDHHFPESSPSAGAGTGWCRECCWPGRFCPRCAGSGYRVSPQTTRRTDTAVQEITGKHCCLVKIQTTYRSGCATYSLLF